MTIQVEISPESKARLAALSALDGIDVAKYAGKLFETSIDSASTGSGLLAPGNPRQMHQSLHHVVADAAWSDDALLKQVRSQVLPAMTRKHELAGWIVNDTGFLRKGTRLPAIGCLRAPRGRGNSSLGLTT